MVTWIPFALFLSLLAPLQLSRIIATLRQGMTWGFMRWEFDIIEIHRGSSPIQYWFLFLSDLAFFVASMYFAYFSWLGALATLK